VEPPRPGRDHAPLRAGDRVHLAVRAGAAGEVSGTLYGLEALRAYFARALAAYPDLRFELLQVFSGVSSVRHPLPECPRAPRRRRRCSWTERAGLRACWPTIAIRTPLRTPDDRPTGHHTTASDGSYTPTELIRLAKTGRPRCAGRDRPRHGGRAGRGDRRRRGARDWSWCPASR